MNNYSCACLYTQAYIDTYTQAYACSTNLHLHESLLRFLCLRICVKYINVQTKVYMYNL